MRSGESAGHLGMAADRDPCGEGNDPFHPLALAHSMADLQEDAHAELAWDLRALEAADLLTDERAAQVGVTSLVAGFYPSLHLNLGECYRKLGNLDLAASTSGAVKLPSAHSARTATVT